MVSSTNADLVVVDTNVVKLLNYGHDIDGHDFYRDRLEGRNIVISFVTDLEIRRGVARARWSSSRRDGVLAEQLKYPVIWFNRRYQEAAVELSVMCREQPPSFQDLLIASTAYALGCPLATDDRKLVEQLSTGGFHNVISRYAVDGDATI